MKKKRIFIILVAALFGILPIFICSCDNKKEKTFILETDEHTNSDQEAFVFDVHEKAETLYIHITGAIVKPGVYQMKDRDRVIDAVNKAGGFREDAFSEHVNLAKLLEDEEKIHIPSVSEYEKMTADTGFHKDKKVNINQAGVEELKTLSGVGDSKAAAIVEYREKNGRFKHIEDIMNISGIKKTMFNKIKDRISVD